MKIQIIGVARSGTSSLLRGISKQGYIKIGEPFNYALRIKDKIPYPIPELETEQNVCVKSLTSQVPHQDEWQFDGDPNGIDFFIEFQKTFIKQFDRVILLDRKNDTEHFTSYLNLIKHITSDNRLKVRINDNEELIDTSQKKWYEGDLTKEVINKTLQNFKKKTGQNAKDVFEKEKKQINLLSEELNIPITYYEDLYGEDRIESFEIINKWDLDLDPFELNDYLHPKYKLKQPGKKPII
tara:strand:+ start:22 stop:738 length:717 start_codon:yes stop_codon:yes gene_type:complete